MQFRRYALFACPPEGAFSDAAAQWLGWDSAKGEERAAPWPKLTKTPRKYGFHGTLKAPFRLADGATERGLVEATEALCARLPRLAPVPLKLSQIGGFLALVPESDAPELNAMASALVQELDSFRAPLNEVERARRKNLTPAQEANLHDWGYPYVMDEFRYHMTLTGHLRGDDVAVARDAARVYFAPYIAKPYPIDDICLMGESAETGRFHVLNRLALKEG